MSDKMFSTNVTLHGELCEIVITIIIISLILASTKNCPRIVVGADEILYFYITCCINAAPSL